MELELGEIPSELVPNSNISPGQQIPVITDGTTRKVELFRWGLIPPWAKDSSVGYKMINARAETIAEKPSFKNAFLHRRCLIPADGFYEWKHQGAKKHPYLFRLLGNKPFTFAGIWETWKDAAGNLISSCAIITTSPNQVVAEYHDRMPVILDARTRWLWLQNQPVSELKDMLIPLPVHYMSVPELREPLIAK
jgi:putative SOS response-associated peptidase YedK